MYSDTTTYHDHRHGDKNISVVYISTDRPTDRPTIPLTASAEARDPSGRSRDATAYNKSTNSLPRGMRDTPPVQLLLLVNYGTSSSSSSSPCVYLARSSWFHPWNVNTRQILRSSVRPSELQRSTQQLRTRVKLDVWQGAEIFHSLFLSLAKSWCNNFKHV